jgi:hypothetical protein
VLATGSGTSSWATPAEAAANASRARHPEGKADEVECSSRGRSKLLPALSEPLGRHPLGAVVPAIAGRPQEIGPTLGNTPGAPAGCRLSWPSGG